MYNAEMILKKGTYIGVGRQTAGKMRLFHFLLLVVCSYGSTGRAAERTLQLNKKIAMRAINTFFDEKLIW